MVGGLIGAAAFSVAAGARGAGVRATRRGARPSPVSACSARSSSSGSATSTGWRASLGRLRDGGGPPFVFDNFVWGGSRTVDRRDHRVPLLLAPLRRSPRARHRPPLHPPGDRDRRGAGRPSGAARSGGMVRPLGHGRATFAPALALLAVTLGAVACTNSWDVPTYLLVTGAGLFHALGRRGDGDRSAGDRAPPRSWRRSARWRPVWRPTCSTTPSSAISRRCSANWRARASRRRCRNTSITSASSWR